MTTNIVRALRRAALALLLPPLSALAGSPPSAAPAAPRPSAPAATERLLQFQREGEAAGRLQPIPGEEAAASRQRYRKSFTHPIPERLQPYGLGDSPGGGQQ